MCVFSGGPSCRCVLRTEDPLAAHLHIIQVELSARAFKASRGKRKGIDLDFNNAGIVFSYEQRTEGPEPRQRCSTLTAGSLLLF